MDSAEVKLLIQEDTVQHERVCAVDRRRRPYVSSDGIYMRDGCYLNNNQSESSGLNTEQSVQI